MASRRAIFPVGPFALGHVADAVLTSVRRSPEEIMAFYRLTPRDEPAFVERMEAVRGATGFRYAPLPGLWSSYVVRDGYEEDQDDSLELVIGCDPRHLDRQVDTMRRLKVDRDSVIPPFIVRSLALGYLQRVGA